MGVSYEETLVCDRCKHEDHVTHGQGNAPDPRARPAGWLNIAFRAEAAGPFAYKDICPNCAASFRSWLVAFEDGHEEEDDVRRAGRA